LPAIERTRRRVGLHEAVASSRRIGSGQPARHGADRQRLRRVISIVDRCLPDGGNCVRRVLLEMALDAGAARETFLAGLRSEGGPKSGHAWLASQRPQPPDDRYDAVISI
jgi:hypothetical protein